MNHFKTLPKAPKELGNSYGHRDLQSLSLTRSVSRSVSLSVARNSCRRQHRQHKAGCKSLLARLAVPQLVRRKSSGRYVMRLREIGSMSSLVSIGLRTTNRHEAMTRMNELSQTAKAFLLDSPEATSKELNEHLKSMALAFLTDRVGDYWSGVEVDQIGDAVSNLKSLAQGSLTVEQQEHIVASLGVLRAAQQRVHNGDTQALLDSIKGLDAKEAQKAKEAKGDNPTSILRIEQGDNLVESKQEPLLFPELSEIYIAEVSPNLKPASLRDIQSAHKALTFFTKEIDWRTHSRADVVALRDSMRASGRFADSTVNKMLAKLCALVNWAHLNGHVPHDYTKGLKLKGVESSRRAFTKDELAKVTATITAERETNKRLFGLVAVVTGARCGELTQLTKGDIINEAGQVCIDINANNGKTLKTKASARVVPLIDGANGFNLKEFTEYVSALPGGDDSLVFGMSRDIASKWFNEVVLPKALPDRTKDLVLHSLRHTMATLLKQAECSESVAQDVLGHSSQSITFGLYGKSKSVRMMADALAKAWSGVVCE